MNFTLQVKFAQPMTIFEQMVMEYGGYILKYILNYISY